MAFLPYCVSGFWFLLFLFCLERFLKAFFQSRSVHDRLCIGKDFFGFILIGICSVSCNHRFMFFATCRIFSFIVSLSTFSDLPPLFSSPRNLMTQILDGLLQRCAFLGLFILPLFSLSLRFI